MQDNIIYDFNKFDIKLFNPEALSANPNAIIILEKFPEMILPRGLFKNPNAIGLIKKILLRMTKSEIQSDFYNLAYNTNPEIVPIIEDLLEKNPSFGKKTFWWILSQNPVAIPILEKNLKSIDWKNLSLNPNGLQILEKHSIKINWSNLSQNPNAVAYLENHLDKIDWEKLSRNENAIHLLEQNPNYICWINICSNPNATHILQANIEQLNLFKNSLEYDTDLVYRNINRSIWYALCDNPNAIGVLETLIQRNIRVFTQKELYFLQALCKNPNAIYIVEKHIEFFNLNCWFNLSGNENAIPILLRNIENLDFGSVSTNKNIMQLFISDNGVTTETIPRLKIPRKSQRKKGT